MIDSIRDREESDIYFGLAKESGNKLRNNIFVVASAGGGFFFYNLNGIGTPDPTLFQTIFAWAALLSFVLAAALCLVELRLDASRFFIAGTQLKKHENERSWSMYAGEKNKRLKAHNWSLVLLLLGASASAFYVGA